VEQSAPHDYYIFGHRHLPLKLPVGQSATYFNLGEWVSQNTYLEMSSSETQLMTFSTIPSPHGTRFESNSYQ
jgi:UDP-2,3-diacylglucosamine hydrolase